MPRKACCRQFCSCCSRCNPWVEFSVAAVLATLCALGLKILPHFIQRCDFMGYNVAMFAMVFTPACALTSLILWTRAVFVGITQRSNNRMVAEQVELSLFPGDQRHILDNQPVEHRQSCDMPQQGQRCKRKKLCIYNFVGGHVLHTAGSLEWLWEVRGLRQRIGFQMGIFTVSWSCTSVDGRVWNEFSVIVVETHLEVPGWEWRGFCILGHQWRKAEWKKGDTCLQSSAIFEYFWWSLTHLFGQNRAYFLLPYIECHNFAQDLWTHEPWLYHGGAALEIGATTIRNEWRAETNDWWVIHLKPTANEDVSKRTCDLKMLTRENTTLDICRETDPLVSMTSKARIWREVVQWAAKVLAVCQMQEIPKGPK